MGPLVRAVSQLVGELVPASPELVRMDIAGDCILDIVLGEIETVFGNPEVLTTWARVAQEVVEARA